MSETTTCLSILDAVVAFMSTLCDINATIACFDACELNIKRADWSLLERIGQRLVEEKKSFKSQAKCSFLHVYDHLKFCLFVCLPTQWLTRKHLFVLRSLRCLCRRHRPSCVLVNVSKFANLVKVLVMFVVLPPFPPFASKF